MEKLNNNHTTNRPILSKKPPRRKSVDFSFAKRESFGEWLINHALSIVVVIAFFVTLGISMLFLNYSVAKSRPQIIIEVSTGDIDEEIPTPEKIEELIREKERLEQEIREKLIQDVKNVQSNEAAEEEGGSESEVIDEEIQSMMNQIDGLLSDNRAYNSTPSTKTKGDGGEGDGSGGGKGAGHGKNFKGCVTVEYKFENPTRSAIGQLYAPAYRAEHSGVVVVEAALDRNGCVLFSSVRIKKSSGIASLDKEALAAARHKNTRFNIDGTAPERHTGTITYTFIAQ